jgi:hypothetical protein
MPLLRPTGKPLGDTTFDVPARNCAVFGLLEESTLPEY